jgi:hypothetical protein
MCTGIELLMLAGTAVSVVGQVQQGQQQKEMVAVQADQTLQQGAYTADAAKAQAAKIRKAGQYQVGAANASLAASGVKLGEGTPLEIKKSIIQNSEQDALSAILGGKRAMSSAQQEAQLLAQSGNNAVTNSYYGAGSTILAAGGQYALGGWKSAAKALPTTQYT